jgi:dTDP-4-amino-4,6-dideoxygalactose transaminase
MTDVFAKSFTQQEPMSEDAIARAVHVMRSGRLHRYNVAPGEIGPVAEFERAFADWLKVPFALALASGGQALQIALRAAGVQPGDRVLTNGFTLAPVPGAIAAVGAKPILIETNENLRPDLDDLEAKAAKGSSRVLMLSNMRGHLPDMDAVQEICQRHGLLLMEDCAHTMGATWKGRQSGTFGIAGCFSTQTYKHMNSGEGGILTSDNPDFMARATVLSGSYMLYERHGAGPASAYFDDARYDMPNCSARMDAIRATLLLDQIGSLHDRILRWNARYAVVEAALADVIGLVLPYRPNEEGYVGSSIQFLVPKTWSTHNCSRFVDATAERGVELKWFGAAEPKGFTSRYDSWRYAQPAPLPQTDAVLARLFDMRLPLTFEVSDCKLIAKILAEEFQIENQLSNQAHSE